MVLDFVYALLYNNVVNKFLRKPKMEDLERYSDYNEYEEDRPKSKSKVMLVLKILIAVVCVSVIGLFAFRMIMFNYYPESVKNIYFTEKLTAYYNEKGGDIGAKTQKLEAAYDAPQNATFWAGNLIVIEDIGELQLSLRFNKTLKDDIEKKWGIEIGDDFSDDFSFALYRNNPNYDSNLKESDENPLFLPIGRCTVANTDTSITYNYFKLVFDDIDFEDVAWLSLAIYVNGVEMTDGPYRIAVYENSEHYSLFEDYKLSAKEKP